MRPTSGNGVGVVAMISVVVKFPENVLIGS